MAEIPGRVLLLDRQLEHFHHEKSHYITECVWFSVKEQEKTLPIGMLLVYSYYKFESLIVEKYVRERSKITLRILILDYIYH